VSAVVGSGPGGPVLPPILQSVLDEITTLRNIDVTAIPVGDRIIISLLWSLLQQQLRVQTVLAVTWDLSSQGLNGILSLVPELQGYIADTEVQFAVTVPALGSFEINVPPPDGGVTVLLVPLAIETTNVGANLVGTATVDGHNVIGPQGFILGPSANLVAGQWTIAQDTGLTVTLVNNTDQDVVVYGNGQIRTMTQAFYHSFFAPLQSAGYGQVRRAFGLNS
jgi:hypothetical protein